MISAHSIFELSGDAPRKDPGRQAHTVYRDGSGRTLIEWHGVQRPDDPPSRLPCTASADVLFRGRLAGVGGAWYEGSEERISLYLLSPAGAGCEPEPQGEFELDVLSACGWACAQRAYVEAGQSSTQQEVPPRIMLVLHWTPAHLDTAAASRSDVHTLDSRLHEHGLRVRRRLDDFRRVKDDARKFAVPIVLRRSQVQ